MTVLDNAAALARAALPFGLSLAAVAMTSSAHAQATIPTPEPGKTVSIIVYGDDPCPKGEADEIVVCSRQPESERYRIPKRFRGRKAPAGGVAWGARAGTVDQASRAAAGLPNTCSAVGTGGQTGCFQQFMQDSSAAAQQAKDGGP